MNLEATATTAGIGTIARTGGTLNLTGTVNNTGATLSLSAATGNLQLDGGTVNGGTIDGTAANLVLDGGTLAGVTIAAGTLVDGSTGGVSVTGGLTLNGTVNLGPGSGTGHLTFEDIQTLGRDRQGRPAA